MNDRVNSWKHGRSGRLLVSMLAAGGLSVVPHDAAANTAAPHDAAADTAAPYDAAANTAAPHDAAADTVAWIDPAWAQALAAPRSRWTTRRGWVPDVIPRYVSLANQTGFVGSFQPAGPTRTAQNAFFRPLGTNGRTCFSCHQPQNGWSLGPDTVVAKFLATLGRDPLFAPVDGADCPNLTEGEDAGGYLRIGQFLSARKQLFTRANIRVFLPLPAEREWIVRIVHDPNGCQIHPEYGLPNGFLSFYRQVLQAANTRFLDRPADVLIMLDGREPSLASRFVNATLVHAQAERPPTAEQIAQGVAFQNGLFTAQDFDFRANNLGRGRHPSSVTMFLSNLESNGSLVESFTLFDDDWTTLLGDARTSRLLARQSIARGQEIFNTKTFTIDRVPGLNDEIGIPALPGGSCGTCHNNQNIGNDLLFRRPMRLGIGDSTSVALPPSDEMPLFSFLCPRGSIPFVDNPVVVDGVAYDELQTTDPGQGFITGKCSDLGKIKVPTLRGLAANAPYFHGGEAKTIGDLVDFYDERFSIGFDDRERRDLINFLNAL